MRRRSVSRIMARKYARRRKRSGFEIMLEEWFQEQDWRIQPQAAIGRCHVDFLIGERLVVEAQGCYFHGCEKCQKKLSKRQLRRRAQDRLRFLFLTQAGYLVLPLWECEVKGRGKTWTVKKVRNSLCRSGLPSAPPSP